VSRARLKFHQALLGDVLYFSEKSEKGSRVRKASNADIDKSALIANAIALQLGAVDRLVAQKPQTLGNLFESRCMEFLREFFQPENSAHLRPGEFIVRRLAGNEKVPLGRYQQYAHLQVLQEAIAKDSRLASALGNEYYIKPDLIIERSPSDDRHINEPGNIVDSQTALHTDLRAANHKYPLSMPASPVSGQSGLIAGRTYDRKRTP
jgi:hypothetical protein